MSEAAAPALSTDIVAEVIDNGQISSQQILVVGLCMFFNMLEAEKLNDKRIHLFSIVKVCFKRMLELEDDQIGYASHLTRRDRNNQFNVNSEADVYAGELYGQYRYKHLFHLSGFFLPSF